MSENKKTPWWSEECKFFGSFYMEGDDSEEGYLEARKLTIQQRTAEDTQGVIRLLGLTGKERILDIPCGYGRHSIALAKKGFVVTGSDINRVHLGRAIRNAHAEGVQVEFHHESMIEISYDEQFDALINMCYSFGFFETDEQNMEVMHRFYRALKPGGKFLMHTDVNLARVRAGRYKTDEERNLFSGNKLQIIDRYNPVTRRMDGAWIIHRTDGTSERKDYSVRVYEVDEFIQMCLKAGFRECIAYGDWQGIPYHEDAEEIMFVSTK